MDILPGERLIAHHNVNHESPHGNAPLDGHLGHVLVFGVGVIMFIVLAIRLKLRERAERAGHK